MMYSSRMNRTMTVWPLLLPLLLLLQLRPAEARCEMPDMPENGYVNRFRTVVRYRCDIGYHLIGQTSLICDARGRVSGARPFCAKKGCAQPTSPEMGNITVLSGMVATLSCVVPYVVAGNGQAYCNGRKWDRDLGQCRHGKYSYDDICDFETEDMCGWSPNYSYDHPWKRVATANHVHSYRTGPRHDHTFQHAYGGHYMLMETIGIGMSGEHHLLSPIYRRALSLKTACCFKFHYFMYGSGVGTLTVSVKPKNVRLDVMWASQPSKYKKWSATGNQGNRWLEHTISIDEMPDDFQVIITTSDSTSHLGDIAIDDVRLMTGKLCGGGSYTTTTEPPLVYTSEPTAFDLMNCTNRCDVTPEPYTTQTLLEFCGCDWSCVDKGNCCPDFVSTCYPGTDSTPATTRSTAQTTTTTTTTTTTARTTARTTTTRRTPPTTTKTTTTTTRRTTTPSTTVTPTTPKTTTTTRTTTTRTTADATRRPRTNMSWTVRPDDIMGDIDRPASTSPARAMWLLLVAIVLVVAASSVAYRWRRSRATITEKAVSFQNSLARLKKKALLAAARRRGDRDDGGALVSDTESDDCRDVQFEELGVDIRNVSEL